MAWKPADPNAHITGCPPVSIPDDMLVKPSNRSNKRKKTMILQITKVWVEGDKLMAEPIDPATVYKEPELRPCRSPYCECDHGKCTHPGCYDARSEPWPPEQQPADEPVAWPIDAKTAERIAEHQCVSYEVVQLIAREIFNIRPQPAALDRVHECAKRLVEHADFKLGGVLSANSKARDIPSNAVSQVKARHLAALRDALAAAPDQPAAQPPQFPTALRKMWSGTEVQEWINQNWTTPPNNNRSTP